MSAQHHEFALYVPTLADLLASSPQSLTLADEQLYHRIVQVLRLKPGEACLLFDRALHAVCVLQEGVKKNSLHFAVQKKETNDALKPMITVLLPLLKKDDLEAALYATVELGATTVQLVHTQKVQRPWGGAKEFERLQRIMIAAAEQSKQFVIPQLHEPIDLIAALTKIAPSVMRIFFDPDGSLLGTVAQQLNAARPEQILVLVGPEADLSDAEKEAVRNAKFIACALTPTVLRSVQAVAVGLGAIRSLVR